MDPTDDRLWLGAALAEAPGGFAAAWLLEGMDGEMWRRLAACFVRVLWMPAHQVSEGHSG